MLVKNQLLTTLHFDFEIRDGLFFLTYKGKITLEVAKNVVNKRLEFTNGKPYPMLVQGIKVAAMEKEARDFFSTPKGIEGVKAGAIYVDSVFHSFLGNFFLKVSKPNIPAKIFNNKDKAIKWLEQYK